MIARMGTVVLDCPDPRALADFYAELTGWQVAESADDDWVGLAGGGQVDLAFQRVADHRPPRWPDPAYPQQFHLDVYVENLDVAEEQVLALGATLLSGSDKPVGFRVYADPAGHPFCLCTN
ncbi:MAG TPA: VOC family protein [Mycobacteriales bacterium]